MPRDEKKTYPARYMRIKGWIARDVHGIRPFGNLTMRRLLQISIVLVLVLGGVQSVLAAALCPHMQHRDASASQNRAASEHSSSDMKGHCATTPNETPDQQHETATSPEAGTLDAALSLGATYQDGGTNCTHCMGRSERSSAPLSEGAMNRQNADAGVEAPRVLPALTLPFSPFVKEIIPHEVGPPNSVQRHILISVFLI